MQSVLLKDYQVYNPRAVVSVMPVSYTHLDVYKRQPLDTAVANVWWFLQFVTNQYLKLLAMLVEMCIRDSILSLRESCWGVPSPNPAMAAKAA